MEKPTFLAARRMSPVPPPVSPRRKLLVSLYVAWVLLAGSYLLYSTTSQTGIGGWVLAQQLEWFGSASLDLAAPLAILLVLLLPLLLATLLLPKSELAQLTGPPLPRQPAAPITWPKLLAMAAVPPLLALPTYFYMQHQAERDQNRPVVPIDLLARPAAPVPPDTKFVRLQAILQADYQYTLQETSNGQVRKTDRYVPLTGPNWRPGQPVRFFLDTSTDGYYDEASRRTIIFASTPPVSAAFSGELHAGTLPTVVRREFARHQVEAADLHYVLEDLYMPAGRPPSAAAHQYWFIPTLGIGLGVAIALGGGLGLFIRRRRGLA